MTWRTGLPANSGEADAVLVFGGDGTIHRHLADLARLRLPVLVVPCGSGNDFARALGLRRVGDSLAAWNRFAADGSNVREVDLGVITLVETADTEPAPHRHYFCTVGGVGLDCEMARRASQYPRWLRGNGGYLLSLLPALFAFSPVSARITRPGGDPARESAEPRFRPILLAAFAIVPAYGGGMKIAPRALLDDGKLDICLVNNIDKIKLLRLFPTVYFGRHLNVEEVEYFQTDSLRLETQPPVDVYADGEYICRTPIEAGIVRGGLRVITTPPG